MDPAATGPRKPSAAALASDTTGAAAAAVREPAAAALDLAVGAAIMVAVGLGGAGLLVWWALAFHRTNARLWMVPAGLVLLGTPLVAWVSVFASGPCDRRRLLPPPAVDDDPGA